MWRRTSDEGLCTRTVGVLPAAEIARHDGHGPSYPLLPAGARDGDDVCAKLVEGRQELGVELLAARAGVADAVGEPGDVDVEQEIEAGEALLRLLHNPGRAVGIVVAAVDDSAEEVRVVDQER